MEKNVHIIHDKDWLGREISNGYISETSDTSNTSIIGDLVGSAISKLIEIPISKETSKLQHALEAEKQEEEINDLSQKFYCILDAIKTQFIYYETADLSQYNKFINTVSISHNEYIPRIITARYKYLLKCYLDIANNIMTDDYNKQNIISNLRLINLFERDDRIDSIIAYVYNATDVEKLSFMLLNLIPIMPKSIIYDYIVKYFDGYAILFYKEGQNGEQPLNELINILKQHFEIESYLSNYKKDLINRLMMVGRERFPLLNKRNEILTWCNMLIFLHHKEYACKLIIKCCQDNNTDALLSLLKTLDY